MTRIQPEDLVRCFRFTIDVEPEDAPPDAELPKKLGAFDLRWEGPSLIMTRGIRRDGPALIKVLHKPRVALFVTLYAEDGKPFRRWRLRYDHIQNRGFDWLNAVKDQAAYEAVAFIGADMAEVPCA